MNYGPLEFAAYLDRKGTGRGESAAVKAAREAAPLKTASERPENNQLTIVSGGPLQPVAARTTPAQFVRVFEAIAVRGPSWLQSSEPVGILVRETRSPVVLVLSSHQTVRWKIELVPGAALAAVLIAGYGQSAVDGANGVMVTSIGGFYAFKQGSAEFRHLESEVLRCTGRQIEKFQCVYAGQRFEVGGE